MDLNSYSVTSIFDLTLLSFVGCDPGGRSRGHAKTTDLVITGWSVVSGYIASGVSSGADPFS